MNAKLTTIQNTDWSKYDLQGWLRQFGLWQSSTIGRYGNINPIAVAITKARTNIKDFDREKLIAFYMCDEKFYEKRKKVDQVCEITDNEARAVQRLVLDIVLSAKTLNSEAQLEWMSAIVDRYFNLSSWAEMKSEFRTEMEAKYDVRCGLAVLHSRYPFIKYIKGT
ncbi:hypothetical protein ACMXYY_14545, partial [Acinetobacter courvalinii]